MAQNKVFVANPCPPQSSTRSLHAKSNLDQCLAECRKWEDEDERVVQKRVSPEAAVPVRNLCIPCVDQERHAAHLGGRPDAAPTCGEQQLSPQSVISHRRVNRQTSQSEHRHFVAPYTSLDDCWCPCTGHRGWTYTVVAKNSPAIVSGYCDECLGATGIVVLAGKPLEVGVQVIVT